MSPATPRHWWRRPARVALVGAALWLGACAGSEAKTAGVTVTPPAVVTPPAELEVPRSQTACFTRQEPAANIPGVKGYRLAETKALPAGVVPTVKAVRFLGGGDTRLLEAEICYAADGGAVAGRYTTALELQLFSVDAEKLAGANRVAPVRRLPFTQVIQVK